MNASLSLLSPAAAKEHFDRNQTSSNQQSIKDGSLEYQYKENVELLPEDFPFSNSEKFE